MRSSVGLGFLLFAVAAATPVFAQMGPGSPTSSVGGIWQTGTGPVLYTGRETPNLQPAVPAQPVSQAAAPSPYPQATGVPWAGGTFYAGGTGGTFYDDNVFATNTNRLPDWAFFQRPQAAWLKQGANYSLAVDGFVEGREYATYSSEDQVNGGAGASFTVMPNNDTQIVGSFRYLHEHLDRGASETVISLPTGSELLSSVFTRPVAYDEAIQSLALNRRYGNWWSSVGGAGLEINYQNATIGSLFGPNPYTGDTVNFNYADGGIGTGNARVGYVVMPLTSVFVEAAANTREWGVDYFDSTGYRVVGGVLFEQGEGAHLKGEAWAGYMNQQYNGAYMAPISTWTYGVSLAAIITPDLTAVVEGRREPKEAALSLTPTGTVLGASDTTCDIGPGGAVCVSNIESQIGGRLDYRILPKVFIGGGVAYLEDDYQGVYGADRSDRSYGPLASLKYYYLPNLVFAFDYRNLSFGSSGGTGGPIPVSVLPFYKDVYIFSVSGTY